MTIDREIRTRYLEAFRRIRHDFSDELPPQRVTAQDGDYKCRGNVIAGVRSRVEILFMRGIIQGSEAIEKGRAFSKQVAERDFSVFSTRQDIDQLNEILDVMIEELS